MSAREDILDGRIDDNLLEKSGLVYTCSCGWIDLGHLNPTNIRMEIGAANLWTQLKNEGKPAIDQRCGPAPAGSNSMRVISHRLRKPDHCDDDPRFTFPDGNKGFFVRLRQDHARYPGKPGREGRYAVKYGLTPEQKKQVGLSIFMAVSHRFENLQRFFNFITDSGYSQEDLVSNLIGYYIGVGEITKLKALKLCHPVSAETAYKIWDTEGTVGKNKNTQWKPLYAKSTYRENANQCIDECGVIKREMPRVFRRIKPAIEGRWFKEL
jgi:hypothetical protein